MLKPEVHKANARLCGVVLLDAYGEMSTACGTYDFCLQTVISCSERLT